MDARFATLARMSEVVFHARDAAIIWGITNANTLHTILSRYVRTGLLFRLQNGLYSIRPIKELDPILIGTKAIHDYCYVSTETVLARAGYIQQNVLGTTLVSPVSRKFVLAGHNFCSRSLSDKYLFNEIGILRDNSSVHTASAERAVADMLYFNPHYHFDGSAQIDWSGVNKIQTEVGYTITNRKKYDTHSSK